MTSSDRPAFGAREVIAIASKFGPDDEAFIIGGLYRELQLKKMIANVERRRAVRR